MSSAFLCLKIALLASEINSIAQFFIIKAIAVEDEHMKRLDHYAIETA